MNKFKSASLQLASVLALAAMASAAYAQMPPVPAPGTSPRIDAIKKAGVLRAGVVQNPPWLEQSTKSGGEPWAGSSWTLGKEFAKQLSVKLEPILVSNETKVPALLADQMDIMIGPLDETAARAKIIDFVTFSTTSVCMFGKANNPKFTQAKKLEDFDKSGVTMAYFAGAGEEPLIKAMFKKAVLRGVAGSGSVAPIEEIMAGRSDVAPINRVLWPSLHKKIKGLAVFPSANDCQDSKIFGTEIGMGIKKDQTVYADWLRAVTKEIQPTLKAEERKMTEEMK